MKKDEEYTMQDAFIREVDEDLQNESLKKLWDKYGLWAVILVVIALTLAVSYESVKSWYIKQAENRADAYAVALSLQAQGKYQESMDALNMIIEHKFGAFADLAKMQQVNLLEAQGKDDEALTKLEEVVADKSLNQQLHDVATVKLASYKQDSSAVEDLQKLLAEIAQNTENPWYATAQDIIALAYVRDGQKDKAEEIYNQLLTDKNVSDEFKNRIKNILSALEE